VGGSTPPTWEVELIIPDHSTQCKGAWRAEMAELEMLTYPAPILRREVQAVPRGSPCVRHLALDMLRTMYAASGIGMAAPSEGTAVGVTCTSIS
jgi:hypothetical protein